MSSKKCKYMKHKGETPVLSKFPLMRGERERTKRRLVVGEAVDDVAELAIAKTAEALALTNESVEGVAELTSVAARADNGVNDVGDDIAGGDALDDVVDGLSDAGGVDDVLDNVTDGGKTAVVKGRADALALVGDVLDGSADIEVVEDGGGHGASSKEESEELHVGRVGF